MTTQARNRRRAAREYEERVACEVAQRDTMYQRMQDMSDTLVRGRIEREAADIAMTRYSATAERLEASATLDASRIEALSADVARLTIERDAFQLLATYLSSRRPGP